MDVEGSVGGVHSVMTADTNADLFFYFLCTFMSCDGYGRETMYVAFNRPGLDQNHILTM